VEIVKLKARPRNGTGKSYTRKIRQQGWIPGIYYGHNMEPRNIEINAKEFGALLRAGKTTHLIDLELSDMEGESIAIIKEIQREVLLTDHIQHIDFQHTSLNEEVAVRVPLEIVGIPVGVLQEEGVLNHPNQFLTVRCLARDIPEKITVNVANLHVGDAIQVKDISVPNGTIENAADEVVASVTRASKIEEAAPATGAAATEGAAAGGEAVAAGSGEAATGTGDKKAGEQGAKPGDQAAKAGEKPAKGGEKK